MSEYYKFFQNKKCEYFPCHKGIPEEDFNCLFCYCPLYTLGKSCGGNCEFLENGVKSCMKCGFPHQRSNYDKIISRFQADYPLIKITLLEGIRQEVIKWLDDKRADIAFTSFREPFPYDWIPLSEDRMMAVLPEQHPCAHLESFAIELCRNEQLILPGFGHDDDVMPLFDEFGIEPGIRVLSWFSTDGQKLS